MTDYTKEHRILVPALIDCGATSLFIDSQFAQKHQIPLRVKATPIELEVIDSRPIVSGPVTHETFPLRMEIGNHIEEIVFNITTTAHSPLVLGLSWLVVRNPIIEWRT